MQSELKALRRKLGITLVFVTHDQEEALTLSDRIAVMRDGRIEQDGTPREIYGSQRTCSSRALSARSTPLTPWYCSALIHGGYVLMSKVASATSMPTAG